LIVSFRLRRQTRQPEHAHYIFKFIARHLFLRKTGNKVTVKR
jgi:hypothetical protein